MSEKGTEQKRSTMGRVLKMSGVVLAAAAAAGAAVAGNAIANQDAPEGPRVVATAPANLDTVPATLPPPDKMVVTIPVTETSSGSTILPIVGEAVQIEPADQAAIDDVGGTRLILEQLERCLRGAPQQAHVLDYGCGSGILAIAAAKLGAKEIAAVDIDPQALAATTANAAANGVQLQVAPPESLPAGTYDLVLANILAGPLIALAPLLAARTRQGGRVLLSGILQSQAAEVAAAYARDFEIAAGTTDEGWSLVEGTRR